MIKSPWHKPGPAPIPGDHPPIKATVLLGTTSPDATPLKIGERRFVGTIDATPSWSSLVDTFVMLIENGTVEGRSTAITELRRMAKLADAYVLADKAGMFKE